VPSGTVKVEASFEIEEGKETKITLDFDRSIKQQGQGGWLMTPVVAKASVEVVDGTDSGAEVHEEGQIS
jgi:hypothetical protein